MPWSLLAEVLASVESLASRLSQNLAEPHSLAVDIKEATLRPLAVSPSTLPTEFSLLLTGTNLRLGAGTILSIAGNAALSLLETDSRLSSPKPDTMDRQSFARDMLLASDTCIAFCDQYFNIHDVNLWLRYENFLLTLNSCGYASKCK